MQIRWPVNPRKQARRNIDHGFAAPAVFAPVLAALQQSRNIAVFSGAGISAASGVATFRTPHEGLWHQVDPEKVGSIGGFRRQPATVGRWMAWRRAQILEAQPNPAHLAIARLPQRMGSLQVVTQNEDDLHERAGSQSVIHLHGEILRPRCFGCGRDYQGAIHEASIILDGKPIEPPRCPHCNHRIRPGSVLFGENLPKRVWEAAAQAMRRCDVCLIVGTSAEVYPAARLPLLAKRSRATLIQVNLESNEFSNRVDFDLRGAAGVVLPELIQAAFPD